MSKKAKGWKHFILTFCQFIIAFHWEGKDTWNLSQTVRPNDTSLDKPFSIKGMAKSKKQNISFLLCKHQLQLTMSSTRHNDFSFRAWFFRVLSETWTFEERADLTTVFCKIQGGHCIFLDCNLIIFTYT